MGFVCFQQGIFGCFQPHFLLHSCSQFAAFFHHFVYGLSGIRWTGSKLGTTQGGSFFFWTRTNSCPNSSNCCIQCWSFPKNTSFQGSKHWLVGLYRGWNTTQLYGDYINKPWNKDPGTWTNQPVTHGSCHLRRFCCRCSILQECCWFNLWMGQNLRAPYAWKHAKNLWKWFLATANRKVCFLLPSLTPLHNPPENRPEKEIPNLATTIFGGVEMFCFREAMSPFLDGFWSPWRG